MDRLKALAGNAANNSGSTSSINGDDGGGGAGSTQSLVLLNDAVATADNVATDHDHAYFGYYSQLIHQQNMLTDHVRTSLYQQAIFNYSATSVQQKVVMDLGAGSGILSYFAAQAGAKRVYSVEASAVAGKMRQFLRRCVRDNKNSAWLSADPDIIQVFHERLEVLAKRELILADSVDTLISEPIGVLLVHERMLESFLTARDHYLKPGGTMFPTTGTIHLAPFSDAQLWTDTSSKGNWWANEDFYGVDLSPLLEQARDEAFAMPVVGPFPQSCLVSSPDTPSATHHIDFRTATIDDLQIIVIPMRYNLSQASVVHGLGGWFDCAFFDRTAESGQTPLILTTHPSAPITHWQQVRFLLQDPLAGNRGDVLMGYFTMSTNRHRSYTIECELWLDERPSTEVPVNAAVSKEHARLSTIRKAVWQLHEQTYYYGSAGGVGANGAAAMMSPQQQPPAQPSAPSPLTGLNTTASNA